MILEDVITKEELHTLDNMPGGGYTFDRTSFEKFTKKLPNYFFRVYILQNRSFKEDTFVKFQVLTRFTNEIVYAQFKDVQNLEILGSVGERNE